MTRDKLWECPTSAPWQIVTSRFTWPKYFACSCQLFTLKTGSKWPQINARKRGYEIIRFWWLKGWYFGLFSTGNLKFLQPPAWSLFVEMFASQTVRTPTSVWGSTHGPVRTSHRTCSINGQWGLMGINGCDCQSTFCRFPLILMEINGD